MDDLLRLNARQAVDLLKTKKASPLDLINAAVHRIEKIDPKINAVPTLCVERANEKAAELMEQSMSEPSNSYLFGLPVLIKDLTEVKGVRTTYGSSIFSTNVPDYSNYLVETLEKNGAIVIGKTNTPEFGAGGNTFNEVFGATLNPWDTKLTSGGSSGGSAAALAAGEIWLATGNDLAGSLRTPASFCSVVGFRPSPGRVAAGPKPVLFDPMGIEGPMARNVKDAALMLDAMSGPHHGDPLSLPKPETSFLSAAEKPWKPSKIAFSPDLGIVPVNNEVISICSKATEAWQQANVPVEQTCPDFSDAEKIFQTLRAALYVSRMAPLLDQYREQLKPEVIWNIEKGLALNAGEIGEAQRLRAQLYHQVVSFFQNYDLLLCPTVVAPPFDVNIRYLDQVDGHTFDSYIGWLALGYAITITACPAISIPCGFTETGLPVGIQIVGPPAGDAKVLNAAARLEEMLNISKKVPIDPIS